MKTILSSLAILCACGALHAIDDQACVTYDPSTKTYTVDSSGDRPTAANIDFDVYEMGAQQMFGRHKA